MGQETRNLFWIPEKYKKVELLWIEVLASGKGGEEGSEERDSTGMVDEGAAGGHQGSRGSLQQGAAKLDLAAAARNHAKKRWTKAWVEGIGTG